MDSASRYEIVDLIASGDFAAVYRGRDRELGREVAIKQIHPQFLADPRQLARYWQEAQLLASLQHPNILTIYDIFRPRGWLIVELMQASLKQVGDSGPMDLDALRVVLIGCLNALDFLHSNGVIHGDVKPSNILISPPNRVKLGDFGLARRASNEEGSLLKGTTKYMAPELLSAQFGPVGPASDLYSLGFAAYELICGAQFESLLPNLATFGRDRQIGWMMWHSAADLKLPEIQRILAGVPDDLARVVEKLIAKDQSQRYRTAREVLFDLRAGQQPTELAPPPDPAAEMAAADAARRKRRVRYLAILAAAFAGMLAVVMLLPRKPPQGPGGPPPPLHGVVTSVYPDEFKIAIALSEDGAPKEVDVSQRYGKVLINNESHLLRDLQPHDTVVIDRIRDDRGREKATEIQAFRPIKDVGIVQEVKADEAALVLRVTEGDQAGRTVRIDVPKDLNILLNNKREFRGKRVALGDLRPEDRVVAHHVGQEAGRKATELTLERVVKEQGVLREIDLKKNQLTVALDGSDTNRMTLPFAPQCEITLNNQAKLNERLLKPQDLWPGDKVTVAHDVRVVRVDAYRLLGQEGVIEKVHVDARTLDVLLDGGRTPTVYLIGPKCKITLGGEAAELGDLRNKDRVQITHDSPDAKTPEALALEATREADDQRWAILIATQNYDDKTLTPLEYPASDAKLLADTFVKRYQVPAEHAVLLVDESRVRLEQGAAERLGKLSPEARLVVYVTGHAYRDDAGKIYLAAKDFDLKRPAVTGIELQWLVDELEKCPARDKLLLLDCSQSGRGADLAREPATADMLRTLKAPAGQAPLRTLTAIASCKAGQRGQIWPDKQHGLFAWLLAQGYAGQADVNRDNRLEPTELFGFLQREMAAASGSVAAQQTPELFLPDDRPARLSEEAKAKIRKLAALGGQSKIDLDTAAIGFDTTNRLAGKELEPKLIYGLLLVKGKAREEALKLFEELKSQRGELLLPRQALVWLRFEKRAYPAAMEELIELVAKTPPLKKPGEEYPLESQRIFFWAGQLREFAAGAVQENLRPSAELLANLDVAVRTHGDAADALYAKGRARSAAVLADFDQRIESASDEATAKGLKVKRWQLPSYATFPTEKFLQQILAGLDQ